MLRILVHLIRGFVQALVLGAFWSPYRPAVLAAKQRWCQRLLCILGVRVQVQGRPSRQPLFLVSNHVSWLDIPVIAAHRHLYFLSKAEVGDWPLIGMLARAVGTLFIKRGNGESARKAEEIAARLRQGHTVLVFPEGTTTDGTALRRFFPQLFAAAPLADVPLQPLALRYRDEQGNPDSTLAFTGDDEFHHHLWRLLLRRTLVVRLVFTPMVESRGRDARDLSDQAHRQIQAVL